MVALCCAFLALALPLVWWNSGAYDEGPHIASGFSYLTTGVFSGGIGNPPLAQLLVALPVLLRGHGYPLFDETALPWARLPVLLATLATALLIWHGGRRHGGRLAGLAGMALWVFEPTVLAHGTLATVDMIATAGVVFTTYSLWRVGSKPTMQSLALAGVVLGATLLTKYSVWMLLPVWAACVAWPWGRAAGPVPGARARHVARRLGAFSVVSVIAYVVLCSGFLWRGVGSPAPAGARAALALVAPALPAACVRGLADVSAHARGGHMAYLLGQHSPTGFAAYFFVAMAAKWTLPFLALLVTGAVLFAAKRRLPAPAECALLLPPIAWVVVASTVSRVDIGIRHLLPILPLLCEAAGVTVAALASRGRAWQLAMIAVVVVHAASSLSSWPHEIGYFNIAAGGAAHGDRVLIDSNIDWGTDRKWVTAAADADATLRVDGPRTEGYTHTLANVNRMRGLFRDRDDEWGEWPDSLTVRVVTPAWRILRSGQPCPTPALDWVPRGLGIAGPVPVSMLVSAAIEQGRSAEAESLLTVSVAQPDSASRAFGRLGLALLAIHGDQLARAESLLTLVGPSGRSADDVRPHYPASLPSELAAVHEAEAQGTAAAELSIANWLAQHGAYDGAFRHAERAWHLDPTRDDALTFLGNLSLDEKAGSLFVDDLPPARGFWLSDLRRRQALRY